MNLYEPCGNGWKSLQKLIRDYHLNIEVDILEQIFYLNPLQILLVLEREQFPSLEKYGFEFSSLVL